MKRVALLTLLLLSSFTALVSASGDASRNHIALYGMSKVTASDGWAVGTYATVGRPSTVALRWSGRSWDRVATPNVASDFSFLTSVSSTSKSDAWAVGPGLVLHWDGSKWSKADAPVSNDYLMSVTAITPSDVWAVGYAGLMHETGPVALHWDGSTWSTPKLPTASMTTLYSVGASSPTDVWAVGTYGGRGRKSKPYAVHWTGSSWHQSRLPNPSPGEALTGVSVRENDVWVVGGRSGRTPSPLLYHWNGKSWRQASVPSRGLDVGLASISAHSANDVWAVGQAYPKTLTLHWDGRSWKVVRSPSPGQSGTGALLASVNAVGEVWAVGDNGTRAGGAVALLLKWDGRSWLVK